MSCFVGGVGMVNANVVKRDIVLQTEYEFFLRNLEAWLSSNEAGKFVLIKKQDILGFFESKDEAMQKGDELFPTSAYFVNQVAPPTTHRVATIRPA